MTNLQDTTSLSIKHHLVESVKRSVQKLYSSQAQSQGSLDIFLADTVVEYPKKLEYGDFALSLPLSLSSILGLPPMDIATALCLELQSQEFTFDFESKQYPLFSHITPTRPGFINLKLSPVFLKKNLQATISSKAAYGSSAVGKGKRMLIEYSEPNPNKPLHIGHARNNFIGSSLSAIFKFLGYDVIRINYINDWGTHVCKAMLMYQKYGNNKMPNKKPDHFVGDFYVMYERESSEHPDIKQQLEAELSAMFILLESGDTKTIQLWQKIVAWVYEGWLQTYAAQNVVFDEWLYQNNYRDIGKELVQKAIDKGIASRDATGAVVAHLEPYGLPNKVLLRSDGTSIYVTQDLQLAYDSYKKYNFDKRLYLVDNRQSDYFKQLFKILELLDCPFASRLYHLSYGVVSLPEGKMSSRTGNVVLADDVYSKIYSIESEEIGKSIKDISKPADVTAALTLAAYRYAILKVDSSQDIVFRYESVTKFEGNTGPYLLYTYARAKSLLDKSDYQDFVVDSLVVLSDLSISSLEEELLRKLFLFHECVVRSADEFAPNVIANYLYELAQLFNSFYGSISILSTNDETIRHFRLGLVSATAQVLKNGLLLLGIPTVDQM